MAVASDLPSLENKAEFRAAQNSVLYAERPGLPAARPAMRRIAKLTGNQNRILVKRGRDLAEHQERGDRDRGPALLRAPRRGLQGHRARRSSQDLLRRRAAQGGSTITQQFVKNALSAQSNRSVFQKLREAALAYHLERKWSKEKILTQYLNTVYFGNGAYGVESAARTYFGDGDEPTSATHRPADVTPPRRPGGDRPDALTSSPAEAALLAGMISSPSMYDPVAAPGRAPAQRRDLVLQRHARPEDDHARAVRGRRSRQARARRARGRPAAAPDSTQPYFTSWVTAAAASTATAPAASSAAGSRSRPRSTPSCRRRPSRRSPAGSAGIGPSASLVAIDNKTGEVKAMVGGTDFDDDARSTSPPTATASRARRSSRSSSSRALEDGVSPDSTWASQPKMFPVPELGGRRSSPVNNYEDSLPRRRRRCGPPPRTSDNSVFAELGLKVGTQADRAAGRADGHPHPAVDQPGDDARRPQGGRDPARDGLRLLDDRQRRRARVGARWRRTGAGRSAIEQVKGARHATRATRPKRRRACSRRRSASSRRRCCTCVVTSGTGKAAQIGDEFVGARPAPPRTTATPGSSASTRT